MLLSSYDGGLLSGIGYLLCSSYRWMRLQALIMLVQVEILRNHKLRLRRKVLAFVRAMAEAFPGQFQSSVFISET